MSDHIPRVKILAYIDVLAARLLALMLLIFSAFVLAPMIFTYPHNHIAWGGNAYNLAAVGATWIFADWETQCKKGHGVP